MANRRRKPEEPYVIQIEERVVHDPQRMERALRQWARCLVDRALAQEAGGGGHNPSR